jgi:hypothetical protein
VEDKRQAFREVLVGLKKRVQLLADLPLARLDAMSLQNEVRKLGNV